MNYSEDMTMSDLDIIINFLVGRGMTMDDAEFAPFVSHVMRLDPDYFATCDLGIVWSSWCADNVK